MGNYSRIISGAMTWGLWGKKLTTTEMVELINHCLGEGVTTFDHADIYGGYTTEEDFGKALKTSEIRRDKIQLISKCGIQYEAETRQNKVKHYDVSKDYIIWSAENSLKLLKTDYLDLLLIHRPSPLMQATEIGEAAEKLKKEGKIKDFGVSNFTVSQMQMLSKSTDIIANQIEFSLTEPSAMYDGRLDEMIIKNITPMAWSPLGSVFKSDNEQSHRILNQLESLQEKYNATTDQLLLAWILKHPAKIHPVIGTTTKKRISQAVKAQEIKLELQDWFLILVAAQGHKVP